MDATFHFGKLLCLRLLQTFPSGEKVRSAQPEFVAKPRSHYHSWSTYRLSEMSFCHLYTCSRISCFVVEFDRLPFCRSKKVPPPEKMVYSFSRLVKNGTGR